MSNLVLELRAGEVMIVNGAPIRFRTRARIELTAQVRFMFGKQIMPPDKANSPAKRIYFALQSAYIGEEDEREANLESARFFIEDFQRATTLTSIKQTLTLALMAAEEDDLHRALKLIRLVLKHEEAILGRAADLVPAIVSSVAEYVGIGETVGDLAYG
jgi:flagellar protein FlbT